MKIENITKRQQEIVILLYRYRFINRKQIEKYLNHKKPHRINCWLKDLSNKKIVGRIYSNKIGENIKPATYYLKTKGKYYLDNKLTKDNKLNQRLSTEKNRSQAFVNHCLLIVKFYLNLKKSTVNGEFKFYTKVDLSRYEKFPDKHPDAYILVKKEGNKKHYFFEIIDQKTPRFVLRARIKQYLEYYDQQIWETISDHPFPKILILCPNKKLKLYLRKHIRNVLDEEEINDVNFYLSSKLSNSWKHA